jgi:hypothetical protein
LWALLNFILSYIHFPGALITDIMGKKGKKSAMPAPSVQELQSTVNGLSISQALAAVKVCTFRPAGMTLIAK